MFMDAGTFSFNNLQYEWARTMANGSKPTNEEKIEKPSTKDAPTLPKEIGGPKGLEPTRYGDWERKGIVSDF